MEKVAVFLLMSMLVPLTMAGEKCVWARGKVACERDPKKQLNAEVRLFDKDGEWIFQTIDPDDLMGSVAVSSCILLSLLIAAQYLNAQYFC